MISVPNHLLPLSGNKIAFFFALVLLSSCNTSKPITSTPSIPVPATPIPKEDDKIAVNKDTVSAKDVKVDPKKSEETDKVVTTKTNNTYKNADGKHVVSFILPFYSNKYTDSTGNYSKSKYAMDIYTGIKLALDSFQMDNKVPLKVQFIDSKTSFDKFINSQEYKKSEVIVGPFEKENIRNMSRLTKADNKVLMLPFYPTDALDMNMQNAYKINPSIEEHCKALYKHMVAHHSKTNVTFIGKIKDDAQVRLNLFRSFDKTKRYNFKEILLDDSLNTLTKTNFENYIEEEEDNVFIISSWDETFVLTTLRKIETSARKNAITVYGLPQWLDFSQLPIELYQKLNVRISDVFDPSTDLEMMKTFKSNYFEKYAAPPSEQSIQGYITMSYLYHYFKSGATTMPIEYYTLNSGYNFKDELDSNNEVKKKVNSNIYIVKYEDFVLEKDE
jgi:hypothetical protein